MQRIIVKTDIVYTKSQKEVSRLFVFFNKVYGVIGNKYLEEVFCKVKVILKGNCVTQLEHYLMFDNNNLF